MKITSKAPLAAGALLLGGIGAGAALASTGAAFASDDAGTSSSSTKNNDHGGETPLTGATADKVKAAALAKYPGATVDRVETDSDGVYEAHVTTKAGDNITVEIDKSFKVTGTQAGGGHGGGGPGGRGHGNETALTGAAADKVKAAALAKYPGATVDRVETDSDGVYEAHITTKAEDNVTVEVNKDFTVTGTETHGPDRSSSDDSSSSAS